MLVVWSTFIPVLLNCNCYVKLVEIAKTEFSLNPTKVSITMNYVLNIDLPPVRINSDNNVLSYMTLKGIDLDPSKYPINIKVTAT